MSTSLNKLRKNEQSAKLREFIRDVGLPSNIAPEALALKPSEYMSFLSGHDNSIIKTKNLVSLGQYFHFDENTILDGTYDKNFIRSVLFLDPCALPEKYAQNQFSYLRSSAHIIKFLTLTRGQHFSDMIMRKLNISPLIYSNLNNKISINYFIDLLEVLAENGLTQNELDSLAGVLFLSIEGTPLGDQFKKAKNYFECYEVMCTNAHNFDNNFEYSYDLSKKEMYLYSYLPFDKHNHLNLSVEKLRRLIRYRQILVGWFPYLSNLPPVLPRHKVEFLPGGIKTTFSVKIQDKESSLLYLLPLTQSNQNQSN